MDGEQTKWAGEVFEVFRRAYNEHLGTGSRWSIKMGVAHDGDGKWCTKLTPQQERAGAEILQDKGFLKRLSRDGHYQLTPEGRQLCVHPELFDEALSPPRSAASVSNTTTIGTIHGNAQVGNHNVQNNSLAINNIQQLIQEINDDPDVDPEKKSRWIDKLVNVATAISAAATGAAVSKVIGG